MNYDQTLLKPEGRVLATMEADGRRRWLYPRLSVGRFLKARRVVGWLLIAIFAVMPFIHVGGQPVVLMDVVNRRFHLFGYTFLPTDNFLLAMLLVSAGLSVFLVTALLGRVWCGWGCPQTVYLELVYRPIERLFTGRAGRGGEPKNVPVWRKVAMYVAFALISLHVANTFLSYFVGAEALYEWTQQSPLRHPGPFVMVVIAAAAMMFNLSYFREQTCLIACPYGRFQSVMLDKHSLIIGYDTARGEPRGKGKKGNIALRVVAEGSEAGATVTKQGDCVDCGLCAAVCPTGIDIRGGLQFECIGCAQCIDVCDEVMDKLERPRGLVRYASRASIAGGKTKLVRPRVLVYAAGLSVLLTVLVFALATKPGTEVMLARNAGMPFMTQPDGNIQNVVLVKIMNRTNATRSYTVSVVEADVVKAQMMNDVVELKASAMATQPVRLSVAPSEIATGSKDIEVVVTDDLGNKTKRHFQMMGPMKNPAE